VRRVIAIGATLLAACGGADKTSGPSGPTPGVLQVVLTSANTDDGALMLTVSGGPVQQVDAASAAYQVFSAQPDTMTTRILVTGDITSGAVARLHVADTRAVASYHASLTQAASRTSFAQQVTSGYSLAVSQ
jgi:hypothetical protein